MQVRGAASRKGEKEKKKGGGGGGGVREKQAGKAAVLTLSIAMSSSGLLGWLILFRAELSPKKYWRGEIPGGGGRGRLYLLLHCHHPNESCSKMGNDESHFNICNCEWQSTTDHNFWRERTTKAESNWGLSAYQPNTLWLGYTYG